MSPELLSSLVDYHVDLPLLILCLGLLFSNFEIEYISASKKRTTGDAHIFEKRGQKMFLNMEPTIPFLQHL